MIATKETILQIIGKQPYNEMMLVDNQDTEDIIQAILNKHEACEKDYDKFSYLFDGGQIPDICERLFDFCKANLTYLIEETKSQYVSKAATILGRGYADCKGYALFCGGVLDSLKRKGKKISWAYRFASYKLLRKKPYHVFIVVFYQGYEIYVDPVFNTFNFRKPAMWIEDYVMTSTPAQIAGMGCDTTGRLHVMSDGEICSHSAMGSRSHAVVGATGAQVGKTLSTLVPIVDNVPVVGTIAGYVLEAGALVLSIFGSKYTQSTQVRWLTSFYENLVLGKPNRSDNTVNAADCTPAQLWFSTVLGVPVYDAITFHNLNGTDMNTNAPLNNSYMDRVNAYFNQWKGLTPNPTAGVTPAMALQAVQICANWNADIPPSVLGQWANFTAAPYVDPAATIQQNADGSYSIVTPGILSSGSMSSLFQNKWVLVGIAAVAALLLFSSNKKKHHA